jgi:D-alanine-D-alanine ligase
LSRDALRILVLAGGPDAERPVSFKSGAAVTAALQSAGHAVEQADITPDDLSALDRFEQRGGDVIFPVLHGAWGEGGGLQEFLDQRGLPYVGSKHAAAALCMDKYQTKRALERAGIATPPCELLDAKRETTLAPPAVVKPACEGSSIALSICHDADQLRDAVAAVQTQYDNVLVERYIAGREITVGVLELDGINANTTHTSALTPLPPLEINPAVEYYDYEAKYERDDTQYRFDINLPEALLNQLKQSAAAAHETLGVAHLCRVDFILDEAHQPWLLEVNTLPGFTDHSLLPMAAAKAGLPMPALCDRLARAAAPQ